MKAWQGRIAAGSALLGVTALFLASIVPAAAKSTVTITFAEAMSGGTLGPTMNTLIREFDQTHPGIVVQPQVYPDYNTLQIKTQADIAAGTPPTLAQMYESWAAEYVKDNALVPLNSFIDGPAGFTKAQLANFYKPLLNDGKLPDGKQWMMPFNKSDVVLYYNKNMLKSDGITTLPTTWTAFAADCAKVTKLPNTWCTTYVPDSSASAGEGLWEAMVAEWGGSVINPAETKVTFDSQAGVDALSYLVDLYKKGYVKLTTGYGDQSDFGSGHIPFDVGTIAGYYYMAQAVGNKFQWGVAKLPAGPDGLVTPMFGTNLGIFAKSTRAQQAAAWTFIKWLTATDQAAYWAKKTGYMPITQSAATDLVRYYDQNPSQKVAVDQLNNALPEPSNPNWPQVQNIVAQALQSALSGAQSPAAALKQAATQAQATLQGQQQ